MKDHFFMVDFCYFLNLSTWLQTMACPNDKYTEHCEIWFKSNFVMSMGPISFAIVAWQNSLVFHSIDKVTSFALHILPGICYFRIYLMRFVRINLIIYNYLEKPYFPGLTCYLMRWDSRLHEAGLAASTMNPLTLTEQFLNPMMFYLTWQMFYFYIQFTIIEKDKTLITSLRHLARDHKNPSTKLGTKLAINLGKSVIHI